MISELDTKDFYKCRGLLNELGHLEVKAVIEGVNPGRVFVDNSDSPVTGLIWLGNNDGFFFIGDEQNNRFNDEINNIIDHLIIPEAKKLQLNCFIGIGNHQKWNNAIAKLFEHRQVETWNQKVYMLEKNNYKSNAEPPIKSEYNILKINEALYKNNDHSLENIEFLRSKILGFWSSPECFFNKGIGYCVVYDNCIVSVCYSGFVSGKVHCVDIETLKTHQGNKLALKVAHCVVKECLDKGIVPYWDCMESNKPSKAVAENIGFTNVFNYVVHKFPF